jgi:hypothetical protein
MKMKRSNKNIVRVPTIIPPRSIVELIKADSKTPTWKNRIGERFRIGYYNQLDGLDTIWLVDDAGNYLETTDRDFLLKYFQVVRLSATTNYFGTRCKPLARLKKKL